MNNDLLAKKCHTEGQHILTIGQCTIHASSNRHDYQGYKLIINASGYSYGERHIATLLRGANTLVRNFYAALPAKKVTDPPELSLDWPDGGVPDLTKPDWYRLIDDLRKIEGKVLVHCMGGHGRTGTALVILLALSKAITKDPVKWLRTCYCDKVVESEAQFKYIKNMGIHTNCEPRPITHTVYQWSPNSFIQEQYNLTKSDHKTETSVDAQGGLEPLYHCILCHRKHKSADFYQTFMDMTGFCWTCHHLTMKTNPDIQSA